MESLLWALDLGVVVYLCIWTLKQEKANEKASELKKAAQQEERKNA
jgi:hypothetical protein